jgi:hypothetical protein
MMNGFSAISWCLGLLTSFDLRQLFQLLQLL